jgi:hypothetical protein
MATGKGLPHKRSRQTTDEDEELSHAYRPVTSQRVSEHPSGVYRYGVVFEFVDVDGTQYHPEDLDGLQICASKVRYDGEHDGMHFVTLVHYVR